MYCDIVVTRAADREPLLASIRAQGPGNHRFSQLPELIGDAADER